MKTCYIAFYITKQLLQIFIKTMNLKKFMSQLHSVMDWQIYDHTYTIFNYNNNIVKTNMNKVGLRGVRRENEMNLKDKYQIAYNRYIQGQFTYDSHSLIKKLCEKAGKEQQMRKIPIYKILIQISKIMMLNELQLLFFGATLQQMKWNVNQSSLQEYLDNVSQISPKMPNDAQYKKLQLSLLLIAYTVKKYLNQDNTMFDHKIRQIFKNVFDKMYQQWVSKVQNHFRFSPKSMNGLFRQLDVIKKQKEQDIVNYNERVNALFTNTEDHRDLYTHKVQDSIPIRQQSSPQIPAQLPKNNYSNASQMSAFGGFRQSQKDYSHLPMSFNRNFSQDDFGGN